MAETLFSSIKTPVGAGFVAWTARGVIALDSFVTKSARTKRDGEIRFVESLADLAGEPPRKARPPAILSAAITSAFDGDTAKAPIDLTVFGTLQRDVYRSVMSIPRGTIASYADVARDIGRPRAWRAVGNALRTCPIDYLIPCHRVIYSSGTIGGWGSSNIAWKRALLEREGVIIR